jgi:hypothetical protein
MTAGIITTFFAAGCIAGVIRRWAPVVLSAMSPGGTTDA